MVKQFAIALGLTLIAGGPTFAQLKETQGKTIPLFETKDPAQGQKAMEMFFGFAEKMFKLDMESQRVKAEIEQRVKQAAARPRPKARSGPIRWPPRPRPRLRTQSFGRSKELPISSSTQRLWPLISRTWWGFGSLGSSRLVIERSPSLLKRTANSRG